MQLQYDGVRDGEVAHDAIERVGDGEFMAEEFVREGGVDYLFQEEDEDSKVPLLGNLRYKAVAMFSFLGRLSVGASYRFLRSHIVKGLQPKAGYLMSHEEPKYDVLGKVVQRTPSPFPICTYDMPT